MMRQNADPSAVWVVGSLLGKITGETHGVPWLPGRTRQRGLSEKDLKRLTRNASACAVLPSGALIQDWACRMLGEWVGTWRVSSQVLRWWNE